MPKRKVDAAPAAPAMLILAHREALRKALYEATLPHVMHMFSATGWVEKMVEAQVEAVEGVVVGMLTNVVTTPKRRRKGGA